MSESDPKTERDKGILRDEKGRLLPGSAPLNPGGRPAGPSFQEKLYKAAEKAARKLGMSFEEVIAERAIVQKDPRAFKVLMDKLISNAPAKVDHDVTMHPSEDEIERIRQERWQLKELLDGRN